MSQFGARIDELFVGPVRVVVRFSCARRDMYELSAPAPIPASLRESLAALGAPRGGDALYVVDVPHTHQITVSPATGRVVIMPRLTAPRDKQRASALEVAALLASLVA